MTQIYLALDTETTGFHPKGSTLTQVAAVAIDAATGAFLSQGTLRIRISDADVKAFTKEAMDIQGWTPGLNEQGKPLETCREEFRHWLKDLPEILGYVAHSARFDKNFVEAFAIVPLHQNWYCTKEGMKAQERRGYPQHANHKLSTLAQACGYQQLGAHQALDDVLACANGFQWLRAHPVPVQEMIIAAAMAS